jgi:hypothetical protein
MHIAQCGIYLKQLGICAEKYLYRSVYFIVCVGGVRSVLQQQAGKQFKKKNKKKSSISIQRNIQWKHPAPVSDNFTTYFIDYYLFTKYSPLSIIDLLK